MQRFHVCIEGVAVGKRVAQSCHVAHESRVKISGPHPRLYDALELGVG